MNGEGFAFNIWYIREYGPHAPPMFCDDLVRFTPVSALIKWRDNHRTLWTNSNLFCS